MTIDDLNHYLTLKNVPATTQAIANQAIKNASAYYGDRSLISG
jgi:hypothetical protein